jgi:glycosyltransferase involved in cell wall biosynthesis
MINSEAIKKTDMLIFLPTYNEAENIEPMVNRILKLNLAADLLIIDDGSLDGTGKIADALAQHHSNVSVIHRNEKGIGGAHLRGIRFAYDKGYRVLVTLDADFSHAPEDISAFIENSQDNAVVVGTRFKRKSSLKEWSFYRKIMTHLGHFLTRILLRLPYDSSGGFRLYRLDKIDRTYFEKIRSSHYEFFFESLTVLHINAFRIGEVPIDLPKRVYGHSKMQFTHMIKGLLRLFRLSIILLLARKQLTQSCALSKAFDPEVARTEWDSYWSKKSGNIERAAYDMLAKFYRYRFIQPNLAKFIQKYFKPGANLLHAGCGGGEVDIAVVGYANITALDLSPAAIKRYSQLHGDRCKNIVGNILHIDMPDGSFDGVYNLGVMEHFQENEVIEVLKEMSRVIKPNGKLVLFWPPRYGVSVIALHIIHFVLNRILRRNVKLHPDEPSKLHSKKKLVSLLNLAELELEEFSFSIRDAFTYVVVVAGKRQV